MCWVVVVVCVCVYVCVCVCVCVLCEALRWEIPWVDLMQAALDFCRSKPQSWVTPACCVCSLCVCVCVCVCVFGECACVCVRRELRL